MLEAITGKNNLESKKGKKLARRESNRRDLMSLNNGKNNLKTILKGVGQSRQAKIQALSNEISGSEIEIENTIMLVQLVTVYLY